MRTDASKWQWSSILGNLRKSVGMDTACEPRRPSPVRRSPPQKSFRYCVDTPIGTDESKQAKTLLLENRLAPVFQRFLDLVHELVRDRAIHHAVVVAQRNVAHGANGDRIVNHHGPFFDHAQSQNADVRLTDYRQTKQTAEDAGVRNGECALLHFF